MIRIKETIIVEGEYDKKKVLSAVDANVIITGGFCIFKDKEMQKLIKTMAKETGIIILTDSDRAGFLIRNFIKGCTENERVLNAYIPEIKGKEKRKEHPGKEELIGVEGMENEIIKNAILKCGATQNDEQIKDKNKTFTKVDLFKAGLYGGENSKIKRKEFLKKHNLPQKISANMLLDVLNLLYDKENLELN